jgi:hypothetical protein
MNRKLNDQLGEGRLIMEIDRIEENKKKEGGGS